MATFTVWERERFGEEASVRAVFVRDGFSWAAFAFAPLWLLSHRMGVVLVAYLALVGGSAVLAERTLGEGNGVLVAVLLSLWFAFEAQGLRRWSLARRGYELVAMVEAAGTIAAERRYYEALEDPSAHGDEMTGPAGARRRRSGPSGHEDVLGLFPEPRR